MTDSFEHSLDFKQVLDFEYTTSFYGTVIGGDIYFSKRLRQVAWSTATEQQKAAALFEATEMIDRLNFRGSKASVSQKLQFPRGTNTQVPEDIQKATYEIAYALLDGLDPEREANQVRIASRSVSPMTTTFANRSDSPFVTAGIYSSKAWAFLVPYLRDSTVVNLRRVN